MSSTTMLCAVGDDDRVPEVLATARRLADHGGFEPVYVHVAPVSVPPSSVHRHVYAPGAHAPHAAAPMFEELRAASLERGARFLKGLQIPEERALVVSGDPARQLLRLARERDAAIVVVGSRGRGALASAVLGSVSRQLIVDGDRPIVVARPAAARRAGDGPVVCGIDGPIEDAQRVAAVAAELARRLRRSLVVAHARDGQSDADGHALLATVVAQLDDLAPEARLVDGPATSALDALAVERDAELLVVGSRGHRAVRSAFERSVGLELVRSVRRPVVIVPQRGSVRVQG